MKIRVCWMALAAAALVSNATAADLPIAAGKLIVVDTTAVNGKAKIVLVAKDALVSKGAGTDPADIAAVLDIAYDSAAGQFTMPAGPGWLSNEEDQARYASSSAPDGGSVKGTQIKTGKLVMTKAVGLGETPLDISTAPTDSVRIAYTVENGAETTRMCAQFASCTHKEIAGGLGFKLLCKNGTGDASCSAIPETTTTTTLDPTTTTLDSTTTTLDSTTTTLDPTTTTLEPTTTTTLCTDNDLDSFCSDEDCNDSNAGINPGATEAVADGIDQDCDGLERCFLDQDGDHYGRSTTTSSASLGCSSSGVSANDDDCNDEPAPERGPSIHPGAPEIPVNGFDDNCNGFEACFADADNDDYGTFTTTESESFDCSGDHAASNPSDCDDTNSTAYPGAPELCDGVRNDCNNFEWTPANDCP